MLDFFSRGHKDQDDYFLGGRDLKPWHVGLSVVATDVGGGFSIGLGGLGFTMGLSGSWMLFTGLLGAWLSAVLLIPKIKTLEKTKKFSTFNDVISHFYGSKVALIATLVSLIGYIGFTSSQLLAGAKLASATLPELSMEGALWAMGTITVLYTAFGGLKAVVYTDTAQWLILMVGLIFIGIPMAYMKVGGWDNISSILPPAHLRLDGVTLAQAFEWAITIIPIWFIGLTLYQRIYACKGEKEAKKAWYLAGLLEWPIMALMGTVLGVLARAAYELNLLAPAGFPAGSGLDAERALPILLTQTFTVGLLGLILTAYFSAILSTADSCLMASSGSLVSDLFQRVSFLDKFNPVTLSQISTFVLGVIALFISSQFQNVLELMLLSYGIMVSGLFIPVLGGLFGKKLHPLQGLLSISLGGIAVLWMNFTKQPMPTAWGLGFSVVGFFIGSFIVRILVPNLRRWAYS